MVAISSDPSMPEVDVCAAQSRTGNPQVEALKHSRQIAQRRIIEAEVMLNEPRDSVLRL
jgi:hypothetical protein